MDGLLAERTAFAVAARGGAPIAPTDDSDTAFYYRVRSLGLPRVSVQGLRHSFATVMLTAKVPIKVVSQALGHSTIALTSDTYSHVLDEMQQDAADAVDAVMATELRRTTIEGNR